MKIENRTVVSAVAGPENITLYFKEGDTMVLPSNEHFTQEVVATITPALSKGEHVVLNMENKTIDIFTQMEAKSKGLVKFFRVAKKALLGIEEPTEELTEELVAKIALPMGGYNLSNEEETVVAVVAMPDEANEVSQEDLEAAAELHDRLVLEQTQRKLEPETKAPIGVHDAAPVAEAPKTPTQPASKPASKVITGAENLKNQIKHFSESDNPIGFTKFMQRIAAVSKDRKHSVDELLQFLKTADLPIADDGCIVAYKRLNKSSDQGILVDTHTGKVRQRIGSKVFMKPEMVDPDRRNECSNGLHIGRRDYMGSFSGNTIIICKIAPEDVIAVPKDYKGSKMRCAGYHIVAEISAAAFSLLCSNKPMTDDNSTAILLTNIIKGNYTPIIETVEIRGQNGTDLLITPVKGAGKAEPEKKAKVAVPEAVEPTKAIEEVTSTRSKADPKKIAPKKIKEAIKATAKVEMTDEQKKAKKLWKKVLSGEMTKIALAKQCKTSTRSLERWAEKFKF